VFYPTALGNPVQEEEASTIRILLDILERKSLHWTDRIVEGAVTVAVTDAVKAKWTIALDAQKDPQCAFKVEEPVFTVGTFIAEQGLADRSLLHSGTSDNSPGRGLPPGPDRYQTDFHSVKNLLMFMANSILDKGRGWGFFVKAQNEDNGSDQAVWFFLPKEAKEVESSSGSAHSGKKTSLVYNGLKLSGSAESTFAELGPEKLALALALATGLVQQAPKEHGPAKPPAHPAETPGPFQLKGGEIVNLPPGTVSIAEVLNQLALHEHAAAIASALSDAAADAGSRTSVGGSNASERAFAVGRTRILYVVSPAGPALHRNGSPFVSPKVLNILGKKFVFETNFPVARPFFTALGLALLGNQDPVSSNLAHTHDEDMKDDAFGSDSGATPRPGQIAMKIDGNWVAGDNVGDFLEALVRYAYRRGWLAEGTLPFKVGSRRYLVAADSLHVDKLPFTSCKEVVLDGLTLFVETNWGRPYALVLAEKLCDAKSAVATDMTSSYGHGAKANNAESELDSGPGILRAAGASVEVDNSMDNSGWVQ
jgi:hypothetical protein